MARSRKSSVLNRLAFLLFFLILAAIFIGILVTLLILSEGPDVRGEPVTHSRTTPTVIRLD